MGMNFNISTKEGKDTGVSVFLDAKPFNAGPEHPNFSRIVTKLRGLKKGETFSKLGLDELRDMFDVSIGLGEHWSRLSDRVSVSHGNLFFDGDPLAGPLTDAILRFYQADVEEWKPLVLFLDKVQINPNPHSRDNLYRWMEQNGAFAIDQDGDLIAYKGVGQDFLSGSSGTAFVNGVKIVGQIPNQPDTIIEMPRSEVKFDPRTACSTGLHAASWGYASSFMSGGKTVAMKINPRDVVSVPTDSGDQKMRVCRYRCIGVVKEPIKDALILTSNRIARMVEAHEKALVEKEAPDEASDDTEDTSPVIVNGHEFPAYFSDYKPQDFRAEQVHVLRWLCGEWAVPKSGTKPELVKRLVARRAWARKNGR